MMALKVPIYGKDEYLKEVTQKLLPITDYRDALPEYPEVSRIIQKVTEKIILGEITSPDEAVELYCKMLSDYLPQFQFKKANLSSGSALGAAIVMNEEKFNAGIFEKVLKIENI